MVMTPASAMATVMWRSVLCIALPLKSHPSLKVGIQRQYSTKAFHTAAAAFTTTGQFYHRPSLLLASSSSCFWHSQPSRRNFGASSVRWGQKPDDKDDFDLGPPPVAPPGAAPDSQVKRETLNWIQKVVIGLNLCPFADKPIRDEKLHVHVVRGDDDRTVAAEVLYRMLEQKEKPGTTVVVAPECYPNDFVSYLSLIQYLEDELMEEHDLHGVVQLAPFHPDFYFQGTQEDDIDNLTNRAPYPSFHILREDEVSGAVQKLHGDSSKVWNRNVRLLQNFQKAFGRQKTEQIMKGEEVEGISKVLKETREEIEKEDDTA